MEYHYTDLCLPSDQLLTGSFASEYVDTYSLPSSESEYQRLGTVQADGGDRFGVSSVVFDKSEEIFWMGNQGGHVTSYYGPGMQKYTSFQVHESEEVRHIATIDEGILALTKTTLRHQIRRGIPKHTFRSDNMVDMQCLLQLGPDRTLLGGHQDKLIDLDLTKMKETVMQVDMDGCAVLRSSGGSLLCAGGSSGRVTLRDLRVPSTAVHAFQAHTACLSDLDVQGDILITCGFALGPGGVPVAEPYVLAWDIRALRQSAPGAWSLPLSNGGAPLLLHFLPAVSRRAAAVTGDGQVELFHVDVGSECGAQACFQVNTHSSLCSVFDISATSQAFVFGDQGGHLHLFSSQHNIEPVFNNFSRETEFADSVENLPFVSYTDDTFQYSSIPLPPLTTGNKWFSAWPAEFSKKTYRKPKQIDIEVLTTMKMQGPIGYAPNPKTSRRNQMPYAEECFSAKSSPEHSFSENGKIQYSVSIPKRYVKVEIRYSKHSSNEYEFDHYNKTGFPGLEATLPNSYCNSMLQVLYYTQPVKMALLRHTCAKEFCLSCELGFLFRMLDTSSGAPCQASNFLRAFRTVPEAAALGLILSDRGAGVDPKVDLVSLIQSWNRFILHQIHFEILETRKKAKELAMLSRRNATTPPTIGSRLGNVSIATLDSSAAYSEDYQFEADEEFRPATELDGKLESRREAEEWDRISLMMQDEGTGRNSWLSPATMASLGGDIFDMSYGIGTYYMDDCGGGGDPSASPELTASEQTQPSSAEAGQEETEISQLFGIRQRQLNRCLKCNKEESRESVVLACALQYPAPPPPTADREHAQGSTVTEPDFLQLVRASLVSRKTTPAWCEACKRFSPTVQNARVVRLPPIMAINCGGASAHEKSYWRKTMQDNSAAMARRSLPMQNNVNTSTKPCRYGNHCARPGCRFKHPEKHPSHIPHQKPVQTLADVPPSDANCVIPSDMYIKINEEGNIIVKERDESQTEPSSSDNGLIDIDTTELPEPNCKSSSSTSVEYSLCSVVCCVEDTPKHIVAFIRMEALGKAGQGHQWYLFNDVSIVPVSADEATAFYQQWKSPCVLFYGSRERGAPAATGGAHVHTRDVLALDDVRRTRGASAASAFAPLTSVETPTPGTLVGMDAEFVTLNTEKVELKSNGQFSTVRPSHMSVARITCVRGEGPLEGVPFIDDYISTQEQVVDYLTKFSGIKPGDLDANFSSKHLTTLKSTYQKLRFLVDSGVIFVGHGLRNDFRVINLVVPPEQVIDTVQLFHLPHHRMVSLKFLAWHFLGIIIQTDTHDSVEDARTALRLRRRWAELGGAGELRAALRQLYDAGEACNWVVPEHHVTEETLQPLSESS